MSVEEDFEACLLDGEYADWLMDGNASFPIPTGDMLHAAMENCDRVDEFIAWYKKQKGV